MKKIIVITALLFSVVSIASSQALKAGFNFSNMSNETQHVKSKLLFRCHVGFEFKATELSSKLSFVPELSLSWQGQKYSYEESFKVGPVNTRKMETDYKDKLTYLQLPLMLNATLSDKLALEFGPSGGILLSAKRKGKTVATTTDSLGNEFLTNEFIEDGSYGDKEKFPDGSEILKKRPVSRFDASLNIGAKYKLTDNIKVGVRYSYGLVDVFRNMYPFKGASSSSEVNKYLQVSVTYCFN